MRSAAVDDLLGRIEHDVDKGLIPAAQVAVALDGDIVVDESFGGARPDDRLPLFSVTKVLPAAAIWRYFATDEIEPTALVVDHLPWFRGDGKERVTVEHLLLHTAGLQTAPLGPPEWFNPADRRAKMATWRCTTPPGEHMAYHPTSAWWVLTELLSAVSGRDHCAAVHELVTAPLDLPRLLGVDDGELTILDAATVGEEAGTGPAGPAEVTEHTLLAYNRSDVRRLGVPGAGGFARAADVARLYQALLRDPEELWGRDVLDDVTSTVRVTTIDELRMVAANRTRGLMLAGDDGKAAHRGFSRHSSPGAFGHDGAAGQIAWADPATGVSMCFLTTGIDRDVVRQYRRSVGIADRAAAIVEPPPDPGAER